MAVIRIVSNPYQKKVSFKRLDIPSGHWVDISQSANPNSRLLRSGLTDGFFPFHIKEITDSILSEYEEDEGKLILEFEGTDDEYAELSRFCGGAPYAGEVRLRRTDRRLENARDILPDIVRVFDRVSTLTAETADMSGAVSIADLAKRFAETTSDCVPVCVMGNYSAGKSSFINALVGREIMPTGDEPTTAKIYRIEQTDTPDAACIRFRFDDAGKELKPVELRLGAKGYEAFPEIGGTVLADRLSEGMQDCMEADLTTRVSRLLTLINSYEENVVGLNISDVIEVLVPFGAEIGGRRSGRFVIFDTPGSNAATHEDHLQVLKKAMSDLSNGLPVFVSEYDSLDSRDNEALYQEISSMQALDSRFTLIVANKADTSSLPKKGFLPEEEGRILSQVIPRSLYSEGIFFVSSVMGLGAKTGGRFRDPHCEEIFEDNRSKYDGSENSRFHKELYRYNILPGQLRDQSAEACRLCPDAVYANSGLYAVERELQIFAEKYSAYNKCEQARNYLKGIISETEIVIREKQNSHEITKRNLQERLETEKQKLLASMDREKDDLQQQFEQEYAAQSGSLSADLKKEKMLEDLDEVNRKCIACVEQEYGYSEQTADAREAFRAVGGNLKGSFRKAFEKGSLTELKGLGRNLAADARGAGSRLQEQYRLKKEIDSKASARVLQELAENFDVQAADVRQRLNLWSDGFLQEQEGACRSALTALVSGAGILSPEKRAELEGIILTFPRLDRAVRAEEIFEKEDFRMKLQIGSWKILGFEMLDAGRLQEFYNEELQHIVNDACGKLAAGSLKSFEGWLRELVAAITGKVVEYNRLLSDWQAEIDGETAEISRLEEKLADLRDCSDQIGRMLCWKVSDPPAAD